MKIESLKIFIDLADTLNFTRTSENMNLTQPAISQTIKSMENELQCALFIRDKKSVHLTENGKLFYEDIKPFINNYNRSLNRMKNREILNNNSLIVGYTETFFELEYIPKLLKSFTQQYPHGKLQIVKANHNNLKKQLINGECDIIFQSEDSIMNIPDLAFDRILEGKFVCVMATNHPLAKRSLIQFDMLENESIMLLNDSLCPPKQTHIQEVIKKRVKQANYIYSDSVMTIHTMIKSGLGISILPNFVTKLSSLQENAGFTLCTLDYQTELSYGLVTNKKNDKRFIKEFKKFAKLSFEQDFDLD